MGARTRTAPHDAEVRAAIDALRRIVQALRISARDVERRTTLSGAQLFALAEIAANPGASVNDVAALTLTHQSSVSVVIRRLVDRRLVAKVPAGNDRRKQSLMVTAAGRKALARVPDVVQQQLIAAIAARPTRERRTLVRALAAVALAVSPDTAAAHPPMLFEEGARRRRRRR